MKDVPLTDDLTGYAYDPDNPTKESEKLAFLLHKNLSNLTSAGIRILQTEDSDISELNTFAESLFADTTAQELGGDIPDFRDYPTTLPQHDAKILKAISMLRASLLCRQDEKRSGSAGDTQLLERIIQELQTFNQQEPVIYLSDETKIYGRTGIVE